MSKEDMIYVLEAICKTNEELINDGFADYDDNCEYADKALETIKEID